ncbi:Potassium voltage-gated channel sub H member 7 [Chytriomyces hyalinus]|nr:Potassium voltage-gated channel sub H member 7 [Chytriomyces hyalinus]
MSFYTIRYHKSLLKINREPTLRDWQQHYLRTAFLADILTAFPYELMPFHDSYYFWIIRCIRVYKLPNLLSDSPYCVILRKRLEKALGIGQTFSGIFPLTFGLCAFLHVQACVLFFVGRLCQFSNSIIAQIEFKNSFEQYTWGLFTAIGNTFPLFYKPNTPQEQMVMLCFSILGAALYASIVGTISSFSMGIDASGRLYKQKLDELKEYMGWKDLDDITQRKVLRYYELKYRGKFFEEATLLNEMNESLRMEITIHNCKQLISKVPFLNREMGDGRDHVFLGRLATSLTAAYFIPGDSIVTAGDIGTEMFFIVKGTVRVLVNGNVVGQMSDGAFFGELALIANIPRTASVQAISSCTLYRLTRMDLMRILPEFEDMQQRMDVIYQQRMEKVRLEQLQRGEK